MSVPSSPHHVVEADKCGLDASEDGLDEDKSGMREGGVWGLGSEHANHRSHIASCRCRRKPLSHESLLGSVLVEDATPPPLLARDHPADVRNRRCLFQDGNKVRRLIEGPTLCVAHFGKDASLTCLADCPASSAVADAQALGHIARVNGRCCSTSGTGRRCEVESERSVFIVRHESKTLSTRDAILAPMTTATSGHPSGSL